jgi:hypothetical protein
MVKVLAHKVLKCVLCNFGRGNIYDPYFCIIFLNTKNVMLFIPFIPMFSMHILLTKHGTLINLINLLNKIE